jgi:hypothetical protein
MNVVGIGLARIIENDEYASPIGTSSLVKSIISGARFELDRPRKDLLDRAKSIRSLYSGFRSKFLNRSSSVLGARAQVEQADVAKLGRVRRQN